MVTSSWITKKPRQTEISAANGWPRVAVSRVAVSRVLVSRVAGLLTWLAGAGGLAVVSVVLRGCGPRVTVHAPFGFLRGYPFTAITCGLFL
jgi:hypothetical protein